MDKHDDISKAYNQMDKPEPGKHLDSAILRAARDELQKAKKDQRSDFWQQWLRPLSTVAALGVCLVVVLQVMNNAPVAPGMEKMAGESAATESADLATVRRPEASTVDEIVVNTRRQAESLQEAPMATAPSFADELVVATARKADPDPIMNTEPAENALTAWNEGTRPAPEVWLAGIEAWVGDMDQNIIDQELAKLQRAYPDFMAQDADRILKYENLPTDETAPAGSLDMKTMRMELPEDTDVIASAWAWAAGINQLDEAGDEKRADAEAEKYLRIYPDPAP